MRPHEKRDRISLRGRNTRGGACTRGEIRIGKRALSRLDGIFRFRGIECTHARARAPVVLVVRGWFMGRGRGRLEGKWWYTRATRVNRRSRLMMIPGVPIIDVRMSIRKTSQDRVE